MLTSDSMLIWYVQHNVLKQDKYILLRSSLAVHCLRFCASTAEVERGCELSPGQGTKILHVSWCSQNTYSFSFVIIFPSGDNHNDFVQETPYHSYFHY